DGQPLPPTLLLHAGDDPWVPAGPLRQLAARVSGQTATGTGSAPTVLITPQGGHNGFHAPGDGPACWADRLVVAWLKRLSRGEGGG
ncbi:alpha/beta hydrolase, partial [Synechococcus sp. BA-132 BA5]|nr:alpha/beta hydrolase [Synechococcus sp. BA-132 BA5]